MNEERCLCDMGYMCSTHQKRATQLKENLDQIAKRVVFEILELNAKGTRFNTNFRNEMETLVKRELR